MFGFDDVLKEGLGIINKFIPDRNEAAKAAAEYETALLNIQAQQAIAQTEVNKIEAGNDNVFIAGWRPFIGWTCGIAFAYHYVVQPIVLLICAMTSTPVAKPDFDMNTLLTVLLGMLGLGGLRTYEKTKK